MASDGHGNEHLLKEWEVARGILNNFDERLHDLRKIGFTFLTALLAAESLLIPTWLPSSNSTVLPDHIKLAVLIVNLVLIVALSAIDRNYQVFQRAAANRAKVLERILNLELTEVIGQRYAMRNVPGYVTGVYAVFTLGVLFLGFAVLFPNLFYVLILCLLWLIALMVVIELNKIYVKLKYPYGEIDWTLDRLECHSDDEVRITLTNLSEEKPREFPKGTVMWQIVREGEKKPVKIETAKQDLKIPEEESYTWLWKTGKDLEKGIGTLEEGIYRVHRITLVEETEKLNGLVPLKRKLKITKPSTSAPSVHRVILDKKDLPEKTL